MSQTIFIFPLQDILRGAMGQDVTLKKADCLHILGFLEHVIEAKAIASIMAAALGSSGRKLQRKGLTAFSITNKYQPGVLYFIADDGVLISGALVVGHTINRIGTIDTHRRKGYATKLIKCIEAIAIHDKWPELFSPVNPEVEGLFRQVGWEFARENLNPDGSHDMKPKWSSY